MGILKDKLWILSLLQVPQSNKNKNKNYRNFFISQKKKSLLAPL